jgi:hypothetical protein
MTIVTESIERQEDESTPEVAPPEPDKLVPVAEAIRYRKRAQAAERAQHSGDRRDLLRYLRLRRRP